MIVETWYRKPGSRKKVPAFVILRHGVILRWGQPPFHTREEAERWVAAYEKRMAGD